MVRARVWLAGLTLVALTAPALHVLAQVAPASPTTSAVATVGARRIERKEFDLRLEAAEKQLGSPGREQPAEMRDVLRRQLLETLIRMNLLILESGRLGTKVTTAEAESVLKQDAFFSPGGHFDEARWNLTRTTQAARFQSALAASRERLADASSRSSSAHGTDLRKASCATGPSASFAAPSPRTCRCVWPTSTAASTSRARRRWWRGTRRIVRSFRVSDRAVLSVAFINDPPRTRLEQEDAAAVRRGRRA
jgi:hypothetical protein